MLSSKKWNIYHIENSMRYFHTLPETNITAENRPSQKETSIPIIHFQVRTVSFGESTLPDSFL